MTGDPLAGCGVGLDIPERLYASSVLKEKIIIVRTVLGINQVSCITSF